MLRSSAIVLLAAVAAAQQPEPKLDCKVLYAGVQDSPRTEDWRQFLARHVASVDTIATADLTQAAAAAFDVVVLDCPDPIVRNADGKPERIAVPKAPGVTVDFGKPVIFVGGMAMVADRLQLRLGWL